MCEKLCVCMSMWYFILMVENFFRSCVWICVSVVLYSNIESHFTIQRNIIAHTSMFFIGQHSLTHIHTIYVEILLFRPFKSSSITAVVICGVVHEQLGSATSCVALQQQCRVPLLLIIHCNVREQCLCHHYWVTLERQRVHLLWYDWGYDFMLYLLLIL